MLIDFHYLWRKYNIQPKGILHIGASEGQEAKTYHELGIQKVVWIEAIPNVYSHLIANVSKYGHIAINACVSDVDGQEPVPFHVANNGGQSSSLLNFGTHSTTHPDVKFLYDIEVKTQRLDTLFLNCGIVDISQDLDFLNCDLQGMDLPAIKGLGDLLHQFKWVYVEVNWNHLYEGCALIGDVDDYLRKFNMFRVEAKECPNTSWGDALYIKEL